jgi:hypothetical protein
MKLKPLSLADICPEDATFTLSSGKTHTIRKFTLTDQAWVQKTFGGQNALQHAFSDPENLLRICFHQLPVEEQKEFAPVTLERVDEETGELITEKVGGWRRFAATITNTASDIQAISAALTTAIVGSNALVDEDSEPADVVEKKALPPKIGGQSLTSSPVSTVSASMPSGA